jgi:3-methyladenine DNA glycosylase AlkC
MPKKSAVVVDDGDAVDEEDSVAARFSLKDQLFNEEKVVLLADAMKSAYPDFPVRTFRNDVLSEMSSLGLKQRIAHIADCLHSHLPDDYETAVAILLSSLPPKLDPTQKDGDSGDFIWAPHSHYVQTHGCRREYLSISLDALRTMTQRFSAEFAIRPFLNEFPDETMQFLQEKCVNDANYHVRRLASEGTRPKLPWAPGLTRLDVRQPVNTILYRLVTDDTRYVTRSVANHLNDVSKIDPAFVVETLTRWRDRHNNNGATTTTAAPDLSYITQHALRTLVKQSYGPAVAMLGYATAPRCQIVTLTVPDSVAIGSNLVFALELQSHEAQLLWIQYAIQFHSPARKVPPKPKVFQWKKVEVQAEEVVSLRKQHSFKLMSTRTLHPGRHWLTVRVNGQEFDSVPFTLKK